jgi:hypothetical protein
MQMIGQKIIKLPKNQSAKQTMLAISRTKLSLLNETAIIFEPKRIRNLPMRCVAPAQ